MSARAMLMSPHRISSRPCFVQRACPCGEASQEVELRRIVLAAVGHVDRREHEVAELRLDDARLHVEVGMAERRARARSVPRRTCSDTPE